MERSLDPATLHGLETAARQGIQTIWDRYEEQLPQCGFGSLGVCCRMCLQGPCRIDPFGDGATKGICGATADTIVARNLARFIAGGTAAHSGHAKHLAHTLRKMADGQAPDYSVRDEAKLLAVAARHGVATDGRTMNDIAGDVAARRAARVLGDATSPWPGCRPPSPRAAWSSSPSWASSPWASTPPWPRSCTPPPTASTPTR